jgi:hypothetical protein
MLINQFTNFRYKNTNIMLNICVIHFICFDLCCFFEFLFWERTIVQAIPLYGFEIGAFLMVYWNASSSQIVRQDY